MNHTALVLEGGGMRCVFTAGVLDRFMEEGITFPYVIAVSGSSINGLSFLSGQSGRNRDIMIEYLKEERYIGFMSYLRTGNFINFHSIFQQYDRERIPFDFDAYRRNPTRLVIVTSNCLTGHPMYLEEKEDLERLYSLCRASSSLPVFCPSVKIDKIPMYDGGVCDAIPYRRPLQEGFEKLVIVLTRKAGYRKDEQETLLPRLLLRKHPLLKSPMENRHYRYNRMLEKMEEMEKEGRVVIIRPADEMGVDTLTRNTTLLVRLYEEGRRAVYEQLDALRKLSCGE